MSRGERRRAEEQHEGGGGEQVGDVGGLAAEAVGERAEGDVAEPHAELHEDDDGGHGVGGQADAAAGEREGEIGGGPRD